MTGTPGQLEDLVRVLNSEARLFVVDNFSVSLSSAGTGGPAGSGAKGQQTGTSLNLRAFYASSNVNTAAS